MYHSCHRRKKLTWESPLPFDITQPSSVITHAPFYASTHADLFTSIQALQQDFPLCRVGPSSYHTTGCHAVLQSSEHYFRISLHCGRKVLQSQAIVCDSIQDEVTLLKQSHCMLRHILQDAALNRYGSNQTFRTFPKTTLRHFWEFPDNISNIFGKHFQRFQTF